MACAHMKSSKLTWVVLAPAFLSKSWQAGSKRFHCSAKPLFCNLRGIWVVYTKPVGHADINAEEHNAVLETVEWEGITCNVAAVI